MRFILLLFSLSFLIACSGSKKTTNRNHQTVKPSKSNRNNTAVKKGTGKVDTIRWTEIDRTKEYNDAIEDIDLDKRSMYKVSIFFPFELQKANYNEANDELRKLGRFTQYYAGVKMALDALEKEGLNLKVDVFDAESGDFDTKLRSCKDSDVIIGPRNTDQLKVAANFGKINEIPVISPWKSGTKLTKDNPFFIQLQTSQKDHYKKIVQHAKAEFSDDQIFVLGRKTRKDQAYISYIQSVAAAINGGGTRKPLQEYVIEEDSLRVGETAFDSIFFKDKTSVFILPNWSFQEDEEFIYNTVRKMSGEKGLEDVVFYGMPILLESEKVQFEHYRNLRMRICRSSYVDKTLPEVKDFNKAYYGQYKDFPSEEAFKGYDAMLFVGRQLSQYGKRFQYFLEDYEGELLQSKFDVQKIFSSKNQDNFEDIQYFQNKHLYILNFKNDRFELN